MSRNMCKLCLKIPIVLPLASKILADFDLELHLFNVMEFCGSKLFYADMFDLVCFPSDDELVTLFLGADSSTDTKRGRRNTQYLLSIFLVVIVYVVFVVFYFCFDL